MSTKLNYHSRASKFAIGLKNIFKQSICCDFVQIGKNLGVTSGSQCNKIEYFKYGRRQMSLKSQTHFPQAG